MNTIVIGLVLILFSSDLFGGNELLDKSKLNLVSPWSFEENKGQVTGQDAAKVKFFYQSGTMSAFLLKSGIAYQFEKTSYPEGYKHLDKFANLEEREENDKLLNQVKRETYRMDVELLGANPNAEITKEGKSEDYIQYYNHNALDVHAYQKITYRNIYPNIDWVIYVTPSFQRKQESQRKLEILNQVQNDGGQTLKYDFIVHPGGNPADIRLQTHWVEDLGINADGSLRMKNRMGEVIDQAPISFQEDQFIPTNFLVSKDLVQFKLSNYDKSKDLIIDPTIQWGTYYGDSSIEQDVSGCKDKAGNVYVSGWTMSAANIASGGHQTTYGTNADAFLVKFNTSGARLWATYYGGSNPDKAMACATDTANNVFLVGFSSSSNNIFSGGFQSTLGGTNNNAFIVKFNAAGTRLWGTYYGGPNNDLAYSCAIDIPGNIYIAGIASSTSGVASGGHQNSIAGNQEGFLAKFNNAGARQWGTYYGGTADDEVYTCAVDGSGNVFLAGKTLSTSGIATGGFKNSLSSTSFYDGFLVKFNSAGTRQWGTYYGGALDDIGLSCTADKNGNSFLSGYTYSGTGIASGGFQSSGGGSNDAFLVMFNSSGARQWGTYYGGSNGDYAPYCSADTFGNVYMSGFTLSSNKIAFGGYQTTIGGVEDAFIVKFDGAGIRQWSSYYGGSADDRGLACFSDNYGAAYLAGTTRSTNNIGSSGFQNTYRNNLDAFLVKFPENVDPSVEAASNLGDTICAGDTVTFLSTVANGGSSPTYQWYKNGVLVATTATYRTPNVANGDSFYLRIKSSATGLSVDTAWSNKVKMRLKYRSSDTVRVSICENQAYTFKSTSLNTAGTYYDTLVNKVGCDSFRVLILTVKDTTHGSFVKTICENEFFVFNGISRNITGNYLDTLVNSAGCDSILTLNLIVKDTFHSAFSASICANQSYTYNGIPRNTTGAYKDTWPNRFGCDSIVTLNLNVKPTSSSAFSTTICSNQSYTFNGIPRSAPGAFLDTFTNSVGCDSVVTLNLTVNSTSSYSFNQYICTGDSFFFRGQYRKVPSTYYDTLVNSKSCDSFVTLNLFINPPSSHSFFDTTCTNVPYLFNGIMRTSSGTYLDTLVNSKSCDSFLTLYLTVKSSTVYNYNATSCVNVPYLFNGINRTTSGVYLDTLINTKGCDSFVSLTLTVNDTSFRILSMKRCFGDSVLFNGRFRKTTAIYKDTFTNSKGCDSFVYLDLKFGGPNTMPFSATVCSNNPYFFNGSDRNATGVYRDTFTNIYGCDSILVLNLTVKKADTTYLVQTICQNQSVTVGANSYNTSGNYMNVLMNKLNCDSIVHLDLTVNKVDTGYIDTNVCNNTSYFFNGNLLSTPGIYWDTLATFKGCDSFVRLKLSKYDSASVSVFHTVCSNKLIPFNGSIPNQSGFYRDTFVSRYGCDSFLLLKLEVIPTSSGSRYDTICWDQSLYFKKKYISTPGIYYDTILNRAGCDSFLTLNLAKRSQKTVTISNQKGILVAPVGYYFYEWFRNNVRQNNENNFFYSPSMNGQYYSLVQDDSKCKFKSNSIDFVTTSAIEDPSYFSLNIFPIPADDYIGIEWNYSLDKTAMISIFSSDGKMVISQPIDNAPKRLSIDVSKLSKGVYILEIVSNKQVFRKNIIIE